MKSVIIYAYILISICVASNYYLSLDDIECIKQATSLAEESFITIDNLRYYRCGILLQAKKYIVIQPEYVNLNSKLRLFKLFQNLSYHPVFIMEEFYGERLYKNKIFIAQTNEKFALVLWRNNNYENRKYKFLFTTKCSVEMAAEDFPLFSSPKYLATGQTSPLNMDEDGYLTYCTYRIFSRNKMPFTIKFNYINYFDEYNLLINNDVVMVGKIYSFSGDSDVNIVLSYSGHQSGSIGFSASVEVVQSLQLIPINGHKYMGIPQVQIHGRNVSFQSASISILDANVMCLTLGFRGLQAMSDYKSSPNTTIIHHNFNCRGSEKHVSQCAHIVADQMHYHYYYFGSPNVTVIHCTERFLFRLVNGINNSSGVVQVKLGQRWGYLCARIIQHNIGDILCKKLGFKRALEITSPYYDSKPDVIVANIFCGFHKKLSDCHYQFYLLGTECSKDKYNDDDFSFYSHCGQRIISLTCQEHDHFSMIPGTLSGYLKYKNSLVCQNSHSAQNAEVYCRYFRYPGARNSINKLFFKHRTKYINLLCNGTETSPSQCFIGTFSECPKNEVVWVVCQTVSLIPGRIPNTNIVKISYRGMQSILHPQNYNIKNAHVICRQLGFVKARRVFYISSDTIYTGNYFVLEKLQCQGDEESIDQCLHSQWSLASYSYYGHYEVVCMTNSYIYGEDKCGVVNRTVNSVLNDIKRNAIIAHPWQGHLVFRYGYNLCGATILNKNWLITSASCMRYGNSNLQIYTGETVLESTLIHGINRVIVHPNHSDLSQDFNIALLKTYYELRFNTFVRPICLPSNDSIAEYTACVTTGRKYQSYLRDGHLLSTNVTIGSDEDCMNYTKFDHNRTSRHLCSHSNTSSTAEFHGENGGPLVCSYNGQWTLVGVFSRLVTDRIRLFSQVGYFVNWIQEVIAKNS